MAEIIVGTTDNSQKPRRSRIASAASTNATSVKATPGAVYSFSLQNGAAYAVFLKLYDKASAPTVGTDVPVETIMIPAGGIRDFHSNLGLPFVNGIAYAITKLVADTDTTVVAVNDLTGTLRYL